jgi:O-antigen ligase
METCCVEHKNSHQLSKGLPQTISIRELFNLIKGYLVICLICLAISGVLTLLLKSFDANVFGFEQLVWLRTCFVLYMFTYLIMTLLLTRSCHEVLLIITIPFLTQFYQVCLGREYPDGATSLMRLLPLIIMTFAMSRNIIKRSFILSYKENLVVVFLFGVSTISYVMSFNLSTSGLTCFFLMAFLVPIFYFYTGAILKDPRFGILHLTLGITIGLWILLIGSIGTIIMGLQVDLTELAGTLIGTRNLGDFNSIYSYVLLAWPFAFIFTKKLHWSIMVMLVTITCVTAALGFSRVSIFFTPILIALSFFTYLNYSYSRAFKAALTFVVFLLLIFNSWSLSSELILFWSKRFNVDNLGLGQISFKDLLQAVDLESSSAANRLMLFDDGMRLFKESPIIGHGWASFREISEEGYSTAHNLTVDILVETGLIGAVFFWALIVRSLKICIHLLHEKINMKLDILVAMMSFLIWVIVAHTLGSSLYIASTTGFQVNAITGMLFVLYLRREVIERLVDNN